MPHQTLKGLLVSPDYPPPFVGGSLVYLYNLVSTLDTIDVLTSVPPPGAVMDAPPSAVEPIRDARLVRSLNPNYRQLARMYLSLPWIVLKRVLRTRYDVVLLAAGPFANSILIFALRMFRRPTVAFAFAEELTIPLSSNALRHRIKRALLTRAYRRADRIVSVCQFTRNVLIGIGVSAERVHVIPPMIAGVRRDESAIPGSGGSARRVISVGRLVKRKGFDRLIIALERVRGVIPDAVLDIVGDGPERGALESLIAARQLNSAVRLTGETTDAELSSMYGRADLFVLANIRLANGDCEGCPTVLIEASAHGLPLIAGLAGGTADAVDHGVTGVLVDAEDTAALADAIIALLSDETLRRRMGQAARLKAMRDHRPEEGAARLDRLLHALVEPASAHEISV